MSEFLLEIITPEKQFFKGQVASFCCRTAEGELGILKGHQPMFAALEVGEIRINQSGVWKSAFISDGFMEVRPDEVVVFAQSCEWPEEIDTARAERARQRAVERMRHEASISEQRLNQISLARAMTRLKIKNKINH